MQWYHFENEQYSAFSIDEIYVFGKLFKKKRVGLTYRPTTELNERKKYSDHFPHVCLLDSGPSRLSSSGV